MFTDPSHSFVFIQLLINAMLVKIRVIIHKKKGKNNDYKEMQRKKTTMVGRE